MMNFLKRIFGKPPPPRSKRVVPPAPAGWNWTMDALMAEMRAGKRKSIGWPEMEWARAYELSLIPADMRFPRKGDVYEPLEDMSVTYLTAWAAPFTGSGEAILRKGERVRVHSEPATPTPVCVYAIPVDYKAVERRMVPEHDRVSKKYGGFYFSFSTVELNQRFRLIKSGS